MAEAAKPENGSEPKESQKAKSWAEFLMGSPPDAELEVTSVGDKRYSPGTQSNYWVASTPDLTLFCTACGGERIFKSTDDYPFKLEPGHWRPGFLAYICKNCESRTKVYAVVVKVSNAPTAGFRRLGEGEAGRAVKLGEFPPFGPNTPPRVISLLGPDRKLFLKGRRAEIRGLGIGAFSYYRRVVQNQKGRIIQQIAKVAQKLGAKPDVLRELEAAAAETQFSKAIEEIKHALPESLLINGHNPLTLLHSALSDGLHDRSDEECLEIAQEIRIVLTELAERLATALKEDTDLDGAVSKLLARKSTKPTASK